MNNFKPSDIPFPCEKSAHLSVVIGGVAHGKHTFIYNFDQESKNSLILAME